MNNHSLVKALQAEFVIQHRAGGHDVDDEHLAQFIDREMRRIKPVVRPRRMLSLDIALIRWSVASARREELATGAAPGLGGFLAGWFMRCGGLPVPPDSSDYLMHDSLRCGWHEADGQVTIEARRDAP